MKKNKKKCEEVRETNYKALSLVLVISFIIMLLILILLLAFKFIGKVPSFGTIMFIIIPTTLLIVFFLLIRNMYKDMVSFDKKVKKREKILDKQLEEKERRREKDEFKRITNDVDII